MVTDKEKYEACMFVAEWHDEQSRLFYKMSLDEPRIDEYTRNKARQASEFHAGSSASLKMKAAQHYKKFNAGIA